MNGQQPYDAFTESVIDRIDKDVRTSLTRKQIAAIRNAISLQKPNNKYSIDTRGILPLFFARYYFVFLMGRDRRNVTQRSEKERREKTSLTGGLLFIIFAVLPLFLIVFSLIYFFKSSIGINFFPEKHLWDFFNF